MSSSIFTPVRSPGGGWRTLRAGWPLCHYVRGARKVPRADKSFTILSDPAPGLLEAFRLVVAADDECVFRVRAALRSNVEPEQHHVAVLDDVLLSLGPNDALFARTFPPIVRDE